MRLGLVLGASLLTCCYWQGPRYRNYPRPPDPPPSPTDTQPEPPKPAYPAPADFPAALKEIETLKGRISDLATKDRLFEVGSIARHLSAVASHLPDLMEREIADRVLTQITSSARSLQDVAELLERRAPGETKEKVAALNGEILPQLEALKKFEALSDEYEVQNVPRGCPATYKRALTRISGVHNSIQEKIEAGAHAEIPDVARHLKQVAENMRRLAVNDIAYPMRNKVKEGSEKIRELADRLQVSAEREDVGKANSHLSSMEEPLKLLQRLWASYTGG
jgi:hypothetical protein